MFTVNNIIFIVIIKQMPIVVNLDVWMAKRKLSLNELSELVGISQTNLSLLKTGKARAVRFTTLNALCQALDCKPGDLLDYIDENEYRKLFRSDPKP
jgi:putative transcriptional regulator